MIQMNRVVTFVLLTCAGVGPTALAQPQPIHAPRALKVGDRFRLEGSTENAKQRQVVADGEAQPDLNMKMSLEYLYDVEVLEVANGQPTRQRCTILRLVSDSGDGKRSMLGAPPNVRAFVDDKGFTKIEVESGVLSDEALATLYDVIRLEPKRFTPEMLGASERPRSVGESWTIDPKLASGLLSERKLDVDPESLEATARLARVETSGGVTHQRVEVKIRADRLKLEGVVPDGLVIAKSAVTTDFIIILPQDRTKPVSALTSEMTVTYTASGGQGPVRISANHIARIRESWTRTPLD